MLGTPEGPLVDIVDIHKEFGVVKAIVGVTMTVKRGECLGIVGHNGAGKSTLMGILRGTLRCTSGSIWIDGREVSQNYSVKEAYRLGVRCVFQEPSLCLNLKVFENVRLIHRDLRGMGWTRKAKALIRDKLDEIFPGHAIDVGAVTGSLPAAERQMVEIARAFTVVSAPVRLVILDEPTSALDATITEQFLRFVRSAAAAGQSCILISHRLREIISTTERVVVMRDGAIVGIDDSAGLDEETLVEKMGVMAQMTERTERTAPERHPVTDGTVPPAGRPAVDGPIRLRVKPVVPSHIDLVARAGEVVGLAGLDAHGQRTTLLRAYDATRAQQEGVEVDGRIAYVSGDRFGEGVFPMWTVGLNLTVSALDSLVRHRIISGRSEQRLAEAWRIELGIKTPSIRNPITSLSGGNQQKVLIARALCSGADIILLDDPMRGVDVNSKREMFERIRREAAGGKCFLLYTTEFEELRYCDRTYVFYRNAITDEIPREDLNEDRVLRSSFVDNSGSLAPRPIENSERVQ